MAKSTVKKPAAKPAKTVTKPVKEVNDEKIQPREETKEEVEKYFKDKYTGPQNASAILQKPEPPTPADFLTSKGFSQVHEGQSMSATFEQVHELLKEYRAL